MKQVLVFLALLISAPVVLYAQNQPVQNASMPKDAPVDVLATDFKNNPLNHEIIVFRSRINSREYQGLTNEEGKFSLRLPAGDTYEIFILGFKDSTSYNNLEIPALKENAFYKNPFKVNIQFLPAKTFVLEDCNFETGKSNLAPESYTVLDELVAFLNRKDDVKIEIGGHTDNVGKPAANLKLSDDRARAVMDYLVAKGIDPARLTSKGYGMTQPVADNKTEDGRAQNRRTEVKILE
ncbi:MAG TPA: OmpA family protein [Ferruginibacter sp.]|nr:OmpA family protein [Ferruginibacter sp.]